MNLGYTQVFGRDSSGTTNITLISLRVMFRFQISWLFAVSFAAILGSSSFVYAELRVTPAAVVLDSPESRQLLLVSHESVAGVLDLTRRARYSVADSRVVAVDRTGLVEPLSEGRTEIFVTADEERQVVLVEVTGLLAPRPVSSTLVDLRESATKPPIGSMPDKPKDEEKRTATTSPDSTKSKSTFIRCAKTVENDSPNKTQRD